MLFWWFFNFWRVSLMLYGSDPKFNTVLMRSPNVFGCVWDFYCSNLMIFSGNPRFRAIFVGSSTGFFEKYVAFGALLMYLFDFSMFFTFWSGFGALVMVLWKFVDVFFMFFQVLNEFRWFWIDLIQNSTRFWCVLLMCLGFLLCQLYDF